MPLSATTGKRTPGFTMIEVLVTLVIMMFGLLGIAGLILKGQKAGSEAYQRDQALMLATDIAEKMKTNRTAGVINAGPYIGTFGAAVVVINPDCSALACTSPAQIAAYDLAIWNNLLVGTQETSTLTGGNVGGISNAQGCIVQPGAAGTPVTITVVWQGSDTSALSGAGANAAACGAGALINGFSRHYVSLDIL
jgi:type IV pilus assembly protein PilV